MPAGTGKIDLGGCTIELIPAGRLRLDGGAMFGIIPKAVWSRTCPADEQNRIQLACNSLLVEWSGPSGRRAIIETGHGCKYTPKERQIFEIDTEHWLARGLADRGVDPATISDVILTHLHFDHAGGLTMPIGDAADQSFAPTFPNAKVHVQRAEFDDARANFGIMTMTYREENYRPIDAIDGWQLIDGDVEILPNIRSIFTRGHTRGHQSIIIEGRDRTAVFIGDVMPTRHHVGAPYNMGYDVLPLENRETKRCLLSLAAQRDWLLALDHDPETPLATVKTQDKWFALHPAPAAGV